MTDLIRRALLGDRKAQTECTAKGIVLPCPFCGHTAYLFVDDGVRVRCSCGTTSKCLVDGWNNALGKTTGSAIKAVITAWDTRVKLPIGECGTCSKYITRKCPMCSFDIDGACTGSPDSDFYCALYEMEANNEID